MVFSEPPCIDVDISDAGMEDMPSVQVSPPIVPPEKKLLEEERLAVENIYLKMANLQTSMQLLDAQVATKKAAMLESMRDLQQEMEAKKNELSVKYGVAIDRTTVKPNGVIKSGL